MSSQAQYLTFEFAKLPTRVPSLAGCSGRALIAYDGRGSWWIETLTLYAKRPDGEEEKLDRADIRFEAVSMALDAGRAEDIAEIINRKLRFGGGHMALFGEHMPNDADNRPSPPYVRARQRAMAA